MFKNIRSKSPRAVVGNDEDDGRKMKKKKIYKNKLYSRRDTTTAVWCGQQRPAGRLVFDGGIFNIIMLNARIVFLFYDNDDDDNDYDNDYDNDDTLIIGRPRRGGRFFIGSLRT